MFKRCPPIKVLLGLNKFSFNFKLTKRVDNNNTSNSNGPPRSDNL